MNLGPLFDFLLLIVLSYLVMDHLASKKSKWTTPVSLVLIGVVLLVIYAGLNR